MKYYLYQSKSKIEMLHGQIRTGKQKKTTEFKFGVKVFSASRKSEKESHDSLSNMVEEVTEYIREKYNVGSVDYPGEYVEGTMNMRWGPIEGYSGESVPLVYFGGITDETVVGLSGSKKHLLGENPTSGVSSGSATPMIIGSIGTMLNETLPGNIMSFPPHDLKKYPLEMIQIATGFMEGPIQKLSFLAKTLLYGDKPDPDYHAPWGIDQKKVYLGTPLWVTLD
jgi:hypothetical protein